MSASSVAIIGLGPRGLSILERIVTYSTAHKHSLVLHIVDPREQGPGTHSVRQSDYMLVNTVADQVTMFPDRTVENAGPANPGPTLAEWARSKGYRRYEDDYLRLPGGGLGEPISANDYVPRAMLGEYLSWVFDTLLSRAPENLTIELYRQEAIDVLESSEGLSILLSSGYRISCSHAFLTVGHGKNIASESDQRIYEFVAEHSRFNPHLAYFRGAYPTEELESIAPRSTVSVQGMGLTAHDVIAELTIGRRGRYRRQGGSLTYRPSGREPRILLHSRQGLPFSARGRNQKGRSGQYRAHYFTQSWAESLRQSKGKLDFRTDIWPVLERELIVAHHLARTDKDIFEGNTEELAPDRAAMAAQLSVAKANKFPNRAFYQRYVSDFLSSDLSRARAGNISDPVKYATDILRDLRDVLRHLVDWAGLQDRSHDEFNQHFVPLMNRLAVGPPALRNEQLLALMQAGVLSMAPGPNPDLALDSAHSSFALLSRFASETSIVRADVLVRARIDASIPTLDASRLISNLLRRGYVKPFLNGTYAAGGIAVDRDFHPITTFARPLNRIWALGNIVEGANFYTYVLPRPEVNSRFLRDADQCVSELFARLRQSTNDRTMQQEGDPNAVREHQDYQGGSFGRPKTGADTRGHPAPGRRPGQESRDYGCGNR